MTLRKTTLALGAAIALAACGGSSDSGRTIGYTGKTSLAAITDANAQTVAAGAMGASDFASAGDTGGGSSTVSVGSSGTSPQKPVHALALLERAGRQLPLRISAVMRSQTESCKVSGSVSVTASLADASQDPVLHSGDWIQFTYKQCTDDLGVVVNGILREDLTATDGVIPSSSDPYEMTSGFAYGMKVTMVSFSISEADGTYAGVTGDMALDLLWNAGTYELSATVHGTSIAMEAGTGSTVTASSLLAGAGGAGSYSFQSIDEFTDATASTLAASQFGASARMCSLELDGCVDLDVDPPLRTLAGDLHPSTGAMLITGRNGGTVDLVAVDADHVSLTWDVDGDDGPAEPSTLDTTWACLAGICG